MDFFGRTQEIELLREISGKSLNNAQFTLLTGRRRIGKTSLVLKAYENEPLLYFFVSRKAEKDLCEDFRRETESKLGIVTIGSPDSFAEVFDYLMKLSSERHFTLFIDEFQEFSRVNTAIFSEMQRIWDLRSSESKINLIVCGSIYSLMTRIFKDMKEPLYGRQTHSINLGPFPPSVLKEIMSAYNPGYEAEDLLALYSFTGGVARYVRQLVDSEALTKSKMIDQIIRRDSLFIGEGRAVLIEEFGKDYGIYFSILSAISSGKTSRSEIENAVGKETGGYLTKLENEYGLIVKRQPLFEKSSNKGVRYVMSDNFFTFWFRFIYKYGHFLEIENYEALKSLIDRDYETFSGVMLERYFKSVLAESGEFTRIGSWWDRKGENEIDIVAENELERKAVFYEVKRKSMNISVPELEAKADAFLRATGEFKGYSISCLGLSMEDM